LPDQAWSEALSQHKQEVIRADERSRTLRSY